MIKIYEYKLGSKEYFCMKKYMKLSSTWIYSTYKYTLNRYCSPMSTISGNKSFKTNVNIIYSHWVQFPPPLDWFKILFSLVMRGEEIEVHYKI